MINTNQKCITDDKLDIFNFDLQHFIDQHLDTAIKDVIALKKKHYVYGNGNYYYGIDNRNFTCQMGFIDNNQSINTSNKLHNLEYANNLYHNSFCIGMELNDRRSIALKQTRTYHFDSTTTNKEIAIALMKSYCNWLKKRIHKMMLAATKLDFITLVKSTIPKAINPEDAYVTPDDWAYDDVFTKASLIKLIAHHLDIYVAQLKNRRSIYSHKGKYYLDWLLHDNNLRTIFIIELLQNDNLQELINNNDDVRNIICSTITCYYMNYNSLVKKPSPMTHVLDTEFIKKVVPMLPNKPILDLHKEDYDSYLNWCQKLYNAEIFAYHKTVSTYPISFVGNMLDYGNINCNFRTKFIIYNINDLDHLFSSISRFHKYNSDIAIDPVINLINKSEVNLNGLEKYIIDQITDLKARKSLSTQDNDKLQILQALAEK